MKVIELEFDKGTSIIDIKKEMDYYRGIGEVVCTKINGEMVYSNDEDYVDTMFRLSLGLNKEEYRDYFENVRKRKELEEKRNKIVTLESMPFSRFYYGIFVSKIRGAGKIDELNEWLFFDYDNRIKILSLASSIYLALEGNDLMDIYKNIEDILRHANIDYNYHINLERALYLIKHYTDKGSVVDLVFFKGITESYLLKVDEEYNQLKDEFERKYKK